MGVKQKYDIDRLEWQQFEELSYRCLQYDVSKSITFIEGGNDKGRDFEYEGRTDFFNHNPTSKKYIFQAKHKTNSNSYNSLKKDLLIELEKVFITNNLNYDVYCLVTNISLSGTQHDKLDALFKQFISNNQLSVDIEFKTYSYRHLESCIDRFDVLKWLFPSIIRNTDFKLLLEKILAKNELNISSGWLSVFEKNKENFIYTSIFEKAIKCINENNLLLLSGPSKSGKTFNADMLLFYFFCKKEFTPYKIDKTEDFDNFYDRDKKQTFLFDDAFGKYNIDSSRADSFNRKMEYIFGLIDDNHKCVFTSREHVFKAFLDYSDDYVKNLITKITVEVINLSYGEKESILLRYYKNNIADKPSISKGILESIITHKNFSPETIRAYFSGRSSFDVSEFIKHLDSPDEYLEKDFNNLSEDKKVVILSTLLSLKGDNESIAYCFENLRIDLQGQKLLSLGNELKQLEGSILTKRAEVYQFYHPSMFDFFIRYISKDLSTYKNLILKNFNIDLLNSFSFNPEVNENRISISKDDIELLNIGFERLLKTPCLPLAVLNSVLSWINDPDLLLYFKLLHKTEYVKLNSSFQKMMAELDFKEFINEDIYVLGGYFSKLSLNNWDLPFKEDIIPQMLNERKDDSQYWLLVFKLIPHVKEEDVFKFVDRKWFQEFYSELILEIDSLGKELYGDAYPYFNEMKKYQKLIEDKKHEEALKIKYKQRSDFKQKTNKYWYPRFKLCKEKISVLKSSKPYGFKIYEKLIPRFAHIQSLEENQMNRYIFNKEKKWW